MPSSQYRDFLGLFYRDQGLIDEAIKAHEKALTIEERPETDFYLSILYSKKKDKDRAKKIAQRANEGIYKKEHDERIRPVWKILIRCGVSIIDGNMEEALRLSQTLTPYITTPRIDFAVQGHLRNLLEATGQEEWISKFMDIVRLKAV